MRLAEAETGSAGKATAGEQPSLTICLQDANALTFAILSQAETVTTKIYAGIDIHIRWRVGDPSKREKGEALRMQFDSEAPASIPGGAAAYATPFARGGVTIHILYTRVLGTETLRLTGVLLAHVMAGCVVQHAVGGPDPSRVRRDRIHHDLEQCGDRRAGGLLQPGDGLPKPRPASLPVGGLELRLLHPFQQCIGRDAGRFGRFLDVALREQRRNRLLLLPPEFCPVTPHLTQPDAT